MSRVRVKLSELHDSFEFVSFGAPIENSAYLCVATGMFHWHSEFGDNEEELPDDIDEEGKYIAVPHKHDLDLGNRLVFQFAEERLPNDYDTIRDIFRRRGAYRRFKELLAQREALDAWYEYENQATLEALREWCTRNDVALEDEA